MSAGLHGFAYGEHRDGPQQRSLGFRLLAPWSPCAWSGEVEALARRLQAAPYPDHWPATDLFCSILLETGERLVAVARYGVTDHTPSGRGGGLELIGVVGAADLSVYVARAVYQWLKQKRAASADLDGMDGEFDLNEILAEAAAPPPVDDAVPVLPVKMWQDGAMIFAAATPAEPDSRLGLLEQGADGTWQWLPLVGADFPLRELARRGPLVAWTPHLAGVALMLEQPAPSPPVVPSRARSPWWALLVVLLIALVGANLWFTYSLSSRMTPPPAAAPLPPPAAATNGSPRDSLPAPPPVDTDRLAQAIHRFLQKNGGLRDVSQSQLLANYERLAGQDENFRTTNPESKLAVGALMHLARRSPAQVEEAARQALEGKGYDPELVQMICRKIFQRLNDTKE